MEDLTLKKRILEISYKNKLSHLGSYFSSVNIIDNIYSLMKERDIFILSSGHCALALYVVLEKYKGINAEKLFKKHGGHPHRCEKDYLHCSTGSLGMGITAAIGRAIADPQRMVYCLISDGECAEGSIWESLRFIERHNIKNIKIYVNANGYAAYESVDLQYLENRLKSFLPSINIVYTDTNVFPFLCGLNAHYHVMSKEDYEMAKGLLK
jgi:transketolase